jgi:hypothetical protein
MRDLLDRFISWLYIRRILGARCPDYCEGCYCCEAWREHDELFDN